MLEIQAVILGLVVGVEILSILCCSVCLVEGEFQLYVKGDGMSKGEGDKEDRKRKLGYYFIRMIRPPILLSILQYTLTDTNFRRGGELCPNGRIAIPIIALGF